MRIMAIVRGAEQCAVDEGAIVRAVGSQNGLRSPREGYRADPAVAA